MMSKNFKSCSTVLELILIIKIISTGSAGFLVPEYVIFLAFKSYVEY